MRSHLKTVRVISALLLVVIVNALVFANGTVPSSENTPNVLLGKLVTMSNRPIVVNGAEAITGSIILSGAQLSTSAASLATVQVDNVGTVTVAPSSRVTLNFDSKSLTVKVLAGDATLTTAKDVKGTVLSASGEPRNVPAPAPTDAETARNWGIAGVAVGGAAFVWALIAWNKANDAQDDADAANAALAALRACLAGQSASPVRVCTSF